MIRNIIVIILLALAPVVSSVSSEMTGAPPAFNTQDINPYDNYKWSSNYE